ncbi:Csa1 family protein, partial [Staphylococcus aureus]
APELKLRGSGDFKGSSVGSKELEFNFIRNKEENVYFSDSINFIPTE